MDRSDTHLVAYRRYGNAILYTYGNAAKRYYTPRLRVVRDKKAFIGVCTGFRAFGH